MVLELSSHTDSRGTTNSNQVLSENRAKECYKYLVVEKGIDGRRIIPVGKGENEPRTVFHNGDEYSVNPPRNEEGAIVEGWTEIKLTEDVINKYQKTNKDLFEKLHQFNRRTEGRVVSMEFDKVKAPAAPESYLEFKEVPKK
jgi:outer membrane protein OmpA-like peptidoglycan-associated protein